jgi:uncharacterized protein (DUF433 family)
MLVMAKEYVEQRNGGYYVAGTRISLDSVVVAFLRGESPEGIAESFPALDMENIFGALSFYLANRNLVDEYLRKGDQEFDALREEARRQSPAFYAKLAEARQKIYGPSA